MEIPFPHIQPDMPGPAGQPGFFLFVPRSEALEWDVTTEIGSTSRQWVPERQAWWIAAAYLPTAEAIVERFVSALGSASSPRADVRPSGAWLRLLAGLRARWPARGTRMGR